VDDDPVILRLLEVNFRLEGFAVTAAARGDEVIDSMDQAPPDALVVDVMMPGLDGYELCERLRADSRFVDLPIVLLTARSQEEDRSRGHRLGVSAYMTKPFDPAELVSLVRTLVPDPR
jgi:DNA-binding response OmpR family regulator